MRSFSVAVLAALALSACCMGSTAGAPATETPVAGTLREGAPLLVTVGSAYRVEGTDVVITPTSFAALDTQAGHVFLGDLVASEGEASETLRMRGGRGHDPGPEVTWHGVGLRLSEEGFVYGGSSATLIATTTPTTATRAPATCVPPGLEGATSIATMQIPDGCRYREGGPPSAPRVVTTAEDLARVITCEEGAPPLPVIDFGAVHLAVITHWLSPAYAGHDVRDDGHVITLVTRQRTSCPGDPLPMPTQRTIGFTFPIASDERTFREATCTVQTQCGGS